MKIAVISPPAIPTLPAQTMGYGGIELLAYYQAKQLDMRGHEVSLFAAPDSWRPPNGEVVACIDELDAFNKWYARGDEFDLIHDWTHTKKHGEKYQEKTLTTIFYTDSVGGPKTCKLYSSRAVRRLMQIEGSIVYPGIEQGLYDATKKRGDFFLCFNRVMAIKGTDTAINLANSLGIKLVVAGHDGHFADQGFVQMIKQMKGPNIEYLGEVSWEKKLELLQTAKALIFPFRWLESFSIITVEALLCGCPVICSDFGGPSEIVLQGESGYLCNTFDEFSSAIKNIDKISPVNCKKSAEFFSDSRMCDDYLQFYQFNRKIRGL